MAGEKRLTGYCCLAVLLASARLFVDHKRQYHVFFDVLFNAFGLLFDLISDLEFYKYPYCKLK